MHLYLLYYQIKQRGVIKVYSNLDHVARTCMVWNCLPVLIHWSEYHAVKVQFINFIILEQYKTGEKSL